jgi:hypothetical protein
MNQIQNMNKYIGMKLFLKPDRYFNHPVKYNQIITWIDETGKWEKSLEITETVI